MRVSHLFEATNNIDYSPLAKIWQNKILDQIITDLKARSEDEGILGEILDSVRTQKAQSSPQELFNFVKPLLDTAQQTKNHRLIYPRLYSMILDLINTLVETVLEMHPNVLKLFINKVNIDLVYKVIDNNLSVKLRLAVQKITRTKVQKKFDNNNQAYVFIGRTAFKEEPKGSNNFKKTLEIERLVPIDRFDEKAHRMIAIMKIRATYQGDGSDVYKVELPKGTLDHPEHIPARLIPLIDTHKKRIVG